MFWSDFKKIEMRTNNRNEAIDRHGRNEQNRAVNSDVFHYYREIPSVGGGLSPNAHLSLIRASAGQTTMPTNRSTAEMNIKNTEKCFSEATKGISATKVTPLETDMGNESKEKLIPPPRHDDKRITAP